MAAGDKYWALVETVWEEISIYDGEKIFLAQYENAPTAARLLFAAHWCQSEIRNGGLRQLFLNSTGVLAPEAIHGFKAIDTPKLAELIQEAVGLFGKVYPRAKSARKKVLSGANKEEISAKLDNLESKFFQYLETENGGFENAADRFAAANGG